MYLVTASVGDTNLKAYAGSQSEVSAVKSKWYEAHKAEGLKKGSIESEEVDVQTSKPAMLKLLNELVSQ